jgi:serine/threonine protein kinase
MGTVYLGRMLADGMAKTVAIKVLHPHLAEDTEMVNMFLDEARVATRLRHRNLVGVLDMDMLAKELVIVMEYIEGTTLSKLMSQLRARGEKVPIGVAIRIILDGLTGLHAAHDLLDEHGQPLGLVHRDVSPHNLLVGTDGVTRLTDFGVALAAGRLASTQPDGTVKGKLQYLAPEQVGRRNVDRRVDVFAAGIVLWECFAGRRLFDAPTEAETVTRVLRDPIEPPSLLRSEVSTALDEVCLHALEREPNRRFSTALEFAEALRRAAGKIPEADTVGALVSDVSAETIRHQRSTLASAEDGGFPDDLSTVVMPPPTLTPPGRSSVRNMVGVAVVSVLLGGAAVRFAFPSRTALPRAASSSAEPVIVADPPASVPPVVAEPGPETAPDTPGARVDPRAGSTAGRRDAGAPAIHAGSPKAQPKKRPFMPEDL